MKQLPYLLLLYLLFSQKSSFAQNNDVANSKPLMDCRNFFASEEPVEFTMISDFKKLRSQKKKGAYQTAYAILKFSAKDSLADSIRIYPRGEFRRELCQMPSLMINFKSKKPSPLHELKKMKMVCGCSSSSYNEELI